MEPADETAMTEIMIYPDGRIFVFGLSREVGEILVSLCPEKHPLIESLTDSEWTTLRRHAELGERILAGCGSGVLDMAAQIALTHHERWDGSGYPIGLAGEDIPLVGRITAVADVFDALISPRPYKHAWETDAALAYLYSQRGRLFDPRCVDALMHARTRLDAICAQFSQRQGRPYSG